METVCYWGQGCDCFATPQGDKIAPVELRGRHEGPIVRGKAKPKATTAQYNVVKVLLDAGPTGLKLDDLISKSGHQDARGILIRLSKDPDWKQVIHFAVRPGAGYRIA
jgi:hypothetical protein